MWLGIGGRRILADVHLNLVDEIPKVSDPIRFDLQPGFYEIISVFGCWHGHEVIGPGRMSVMIGYPSAQDLLPARADELVRPAPVSR